MRVDGSGLRKEKRKETYGEGLLRLGLSGRGGRVGLAFDKVTSLLEGRLLGVLVYRQL